MPSIRITTMKSPICMLAMLIYLVVTSSSSVNVGAVVSRHMMELHGLKTYLVNSPTQAMPASQIALLGKVADNLPNVPIEQRFVYSYQHVFQGFAVLMTTEEAQRMGLQEEVSMVQPDEIAAKPHTTRTPTFLDLLTPTSATTYGNGPLWNASRKGEDVIVGLLDTGIWPEHPSFSDSGYGPIPSRWTGKCESYPPSFIANTSCNLKLIGARAFFRGYESRAGPINQTLDFRSPRDSNGHGTHTASTASGSTLLTTNSSFLGFAPGTPTGIAPASRLAIYKVCWKEGCYTSDILAGFDTAISDGVDVISVSLGGSGYISYYNDPIAIGSFAAAEKGIATSCSAGNSGPYRGSVANAAPWIFTVGASTIDRSFPASVTLGNGQVYAGSSLYAGPGLSKQLPLIYAGDAAANFSSYSNSYYASYCWNASYLNTTLVSGKIVVCDSGGGISEVKKGFAVQAAGGLGMIIIYGQEIIARSHILPALSLGSTPTRAILLYLRNTTNATAIINNTGVTELGVRPAPAMASFSSRGPNPVIAGILKPDITAPGVNILAAWPEVASPSGLEEDPRRVEFNIISGTSMSCPHVSGLMALLKAAHPDWTPAAIKSALMTTATVVDNTGQRITDTSTGDVAYPTVYGSGHVNPNAALDPGLIYDISIQEYVDFLCGINYTTTQLRTLTTQRTCNGVIKRPIDLNYPSFSVVVPSLNSFTLTTTRTLTNVGPVNSTYTVSIKPPLLLDVSIVPSTLSFSSFRQNLSYSITFSLSKNYTDSVILQYDFNSFGSLTWADGTHNVTSPISFLVSTTYT